MSYRRNAARPRVALWMLVALGDIVLLLASVGISALVALVSVVTVTAAAVGARLLVRRGASVRDGISAPVAVPVATRRRA
jgi:hypothetical protein